MGDFEGLGVVSAVVRLELGLGEGWSVGTLLGVLEGVNMGLVVVGLADGCVLIHSKTSEA